MSTATVVIPTRNRLTFLKEAVESAQSQRDTEVVVVNDASDDGTVQWLQREAIDCVQLSSHSGRSSTRNAGLAKVRTPWVVFLDDDDRLLPGAVETLLAAAQRLGLPMVVGRSRPLAADCAQRRILHPPSVRRANVWRELLFGWNPSNFGQILVRTDLVRELGGFSPELPLCQDLDLELRLARRTEWLLVPSTVLEVRRHPGQWQGSKANIADQVRAEDVARSPRELRMIGERTLRARALFRAAHEPYTERDMRTAAPMLIRMVREAPWFLRSPILGSMMRSMVGVSVVGTMLPRPLAKRIPTRRAR